MKHFLKRRKPTVTVTDMNGNTKTMTPDGVILFAFTWGRDDDSVEVQTVHLGKLKPGAIAEHLLRLIADEQPDEGHEVTADLWRRIVSDMMDQIEETVKRMEADAFAMDAIDEAEGRDQQ